MIAKILKLEQGVKKTTNSGKEITVTVFQYQAAPYKGKPSKPTERSFFSNVPFHAELIKHKVGDWVELKFNQESTYKEIISVKDAAAPAETSQSAQGETRVNNGIKHDIAEGKYGYPVPCGLTPVDRSITIQACLKVVAFSGIKDLDEIWKKAVELFNRVVEFSNATAEPDKLSSERIAGISKAVSLVVENVDDFWRWISTKCPEIIDQKTKAIDPLLLSEQHTLFLTKNLDAKITQFLGETKSQPQAVSTTEPPNKKEPVIATPPPLPTKEEQEEMPF